MRDGQIVREQIRIDNSSLASQAVGPPMNAVEMSYEGRTWPKLGKRMLALRPLALQRVDPSDSVLGLYANPELRGLMDSYTYFSLVQAAFRPEYWDMPDVADNFPLFFGLAVQAYEATLVSDDSPFDRFSEGDGSALTAEQQLGLRLFRTRGVYRLPRGSGVHDGEFYQHSKPRFGAAFENRFSYGHRILSYGCAPVFRR